MWLCTSDVTKNNGDVDPAHPDEPSRSLNEESHSFQSIDTKDEGLT